MKLILARHGNTFGPGDTPVWVGAKEDYPLVARGREQAVEIGEVLLKRGIALTRIIAGPLKRTREGAELIARELGFQGAIIIDERLTEIDYGSWGGRSDDELSSTYGPDVIDSWREKSIRPDGADWSPSEDELKTNAVSLLDEIRKSSADEDSVLLVTSNGILRFYHAVFYADAPDAPSGKVKTGHLCSADVTDQTVTPECWNLSPKAFLSALDA